MPDAPIDALDAGVSAVVRAINEAAGEIDAAFIAEMRANHSVPEWDRPAPLHIQPYNI